MIALGNDHAAYLMKNAIKHHLLERGFEVLDVGCFSEKVGVDYPEIAVEASRAVADGRCEKGILICGTGIGMSISANKIASIRAALCYDEFCTKMSREHNNANVLCLGARVIDEEKAIKLVDIFLDTEFSDDERHARRIAHIDSIK